MTKHNRGQSNYARLNFTSLHIKVDTKNRLNIAKSQIFAREGKSVSHDDLLNRLLDMHGVEVVRETVAA